MANYPLIGALTSAEAASFAFAGADATSGVLNLYGTTYHAAVAINNTSVPKTA